MSSQNVTVVGLGSMGFGIATSLLGAGHRVFGFDVDPARVERFRQAGGQSAPAAEAVAQCDAIICVVVNAEQTEHVLFGPDGMARHLARNGVIVSCATIPPEQARLMNQRSVEQGLYFLDAPISGGSKKAADGALSIMASGPRAAFARASALLAAMAATVHDVGDEPGQGSAMKSVNQLLAGVHIAAMAEALTYAVAQGLDLKQVVDVIGQSAGASWMFNDRAPHVLNADYRPHSAVSIWPKDLGIVLETADRVGADVPITKVALERFRDAVKAGDGAQDDAAVVKVYAKRAGLCLPGESS